MKTLNDESKNEVSIVGTLLDINFREGKNKNGGTYASADVVVRVNQKYLGNQEVSEIRFGVYANQITGAGKENPFYERLQALKGLKTIKNVGLNEASTVAVTNSQRFANGRLSEDCYATKDGRVRNGWRIRATQVAASNAPDDLATYRLTGYILDMQEEIGADDTPTGRLKVKLGVVGYGGRLDVIEMFAEGQAVVDGVSREWNINDTVTVEGRIRSTSQEQVHTTESSWGEAIPETTTHFVSELIITNGTVITDEDFQYDEKEIRRGFAERKSRIEQTKIDAQMKSQKASGTNAAYAAATKSKYSWDD